MFDYDMDLPPIGKQQTTVKRQRARHSAGSIPVAMQIIAHIVWPLDDAPVLEVQSANKSAKARSFR